MRLLLPLLLFANPTLALFDSWLDTPDFLTLGLCAAGCLDTVSYESGCHYSLDAYCPCRDSTFAPAALACYDKKCTGTASRNELIEFLQWYCGLADIDPFNPKTSSTTKSSTRTSSSSTYPTSTSSSNSNSNSDSFSGDGRITFTTVGRKTKDDKLAKKLGIGLGVPLGILAIAVGVLVFVLLRRRRAKVDEKGGETGAHSSDHIEQSEITTEPGVTEAYGEREKTHYYN